MFAILKENRIKRYKSPFQIKNLSKLVSEVSILNSHYHYRKYEIVPSK